MSEQPEEQKRGRGHPRSILNEENVEALAAMACTDEEIADYFDVAESTVKLNYSACLKKGRSHMKRSIKRGQFLLATDPSVSEKTRLTALIWLGKNYCHQSDRIAQAVTITDKPNIDNSVVDFALKTALQMDEERMGDVAE